MTETHNDDLWREEEHEDSCSCSSHLYLESSSSTEIITVPADLVPLEPGIIDRTFLMERLLTGFNTMGTVDTLQYVHLVQRYGGALGSDTVQYADDTVRIHDTETAQSTDQTSQTLQTWDSDVAQAPDIQDNQDTQAKH